tara:strand:+ start:217 stop:456 length:240 start_codon:yes stop_codon:yes gene_type:complete
MADFDAKKVTEAIVDRKKGLRTRETAAAVIAKETGLSMDISRALTDGYSGHNIGMIQGYRNETEGVRLNREKRIGKCRS